MQEHRHQKRKIATTATHQIEQQQKKVLCTSILVSCVHIPFRDTDVCRVHCKCKPMEIMYDRRRFRVYLECLRRLLLLLQLVQRVGYVLVPIFLHLLLHRIIIIYLFGKYILHSIV